jgi:hypothetical protein
MNLAPGDEVVIAPGRHGASLVPNATGTEAQPVVIRFLPGVHESGKETAIRKAYPPFPRPPVRLNGCSRGGPPKANS